MVFTPLLIADGVGHRHLEAHTLPTLVRPEAVSMQLKFLQVIRIPHCRRSMRNLFTWF